MRVARSEREGSGHQVVKTLVCISVLGAFTGNQWALSVEQECSISHFSFFGK